VPQVEVTFDIDSNGILHVLAKDKASGKEQKIRIEASSGLSDEEIKRMKAEAEANADADKKAKEEVEKLNMADSLVFNTEKQLKEFGDKVPAEDKTIIEAAVAKLKQAHSDKNFTAIDEASTELNNAWNAASSKMYAQGQPNPGEPQQDPNQGGNPNAGNADASNKQDDGVTDVDFEEVK
jgi:molecular chaperone DnaK